MRILTLNCFALPIFAPKISRRLKRITEEIKKHDPDIVCLQEVFYPWHKKFLERELGQQYPFSFVPRNGFLMTGGGICLFSRLPISGERFNKFSITGRWRDWTWAHKINEQGFMDLNVTASEPKKIFHTHLTCNFQNQFEPTKGSQAEIQESQLNDLARAITEVDNSTTCLVIGDLNVPPTSNLFQNFLNKINAIDLTLTGEPSVRGVFYPFPKYFEKIIFKNKIDYVLLRGKPVKSSWKYFFDEKNFLSDHAGIILDIEL